MLREQLDQATSANQQLTLDIQKLTNDWNKAREELEARDDEEQAYFANEHVRLMDMWKTMNNFRRQFNEMKSATQRYVQIIDNFETVTNVKVIKFYTFNFGHLHLIFSFDCCTLFSLICMSTLYSETSE